MKTTSLIVLSFLISFTAFAQNKNAKLTLKVDGVCGMCKHRIENAAIKTKGVKSAVWSLETKECAIIFDERKTDIPTISQRIANVGHDTEIVKATDQAYNSVDACCLYRDEEVIKAHQKN